MKLQSPRGTRDFYPQEMAWQNFLRDAWRRVSIRHGFEEVDGPIFEALELYTIKSGEGIVSELFSFRRDKGNTDFALRPEFTPTLARMVADRANSLPKPIKWFCVPNLCRAERPQRGRLREFLQWNIDLIGLDSAIADAEVILVAVDLLKEFGLSSQQIRVKISHRDVVRRILCRLGVSDKKMLDAFNLLDRRDKLPEEVFTQQALKLGLDAHRVERFEQMCRRKYHAGDVGHMQRSVGLDEPLGSLEALDEQLSNFGISDWCEYDLGIVRGLAYYTGTVFEVHEAAGVERAMAGGGRYDNLIKAFGGPSLPAMGFGMGDVVLTNVLRDKNLIPEDVLPSPDAFIFAVTDAGAASLGGVVASLRARGIHARFSYKATRNTGKLLKDAHACRARYAVILDDKVAGGLALVKNMQSGEQVEVPLTELFAHCR